MEIIRITRDNIDKEHICCVMSGKQSLAKKEWLKQRFDEGLVFLRSTERGKCFIEYIPAENAWMPIEADGWIYIDCLWVSGALKGHGYAGELLTECIRDARAQGCKGLCILCAEGRKREFLADPKFLEHEGFTVADVSDCGITLMMLPLDPTAEEPRLRSNESPSGAFKRRDGLAGARWRGLAPTSPKFREGAKHPRAEEPGFVLYYTDQCPFTFYWVPKVEETAKAHGIPLKTIHITTREAAQNVPAPVTTYALFRDGQFITQGIQSDKKFLALAGI